MQTVTEGEMLMGNSGLLSGESAGKTISSSRSYSSQNAGTGDEATPSHLSNTNDEALDQITNCCPRRQLFWTFFQSPSLYQFLIIF
jgi:hypothetical protein